MPFLKSHLCTLPYYILMFVLYVGLILPDTPIFAAETYYLTQETSFYENTDDYNILGRIRKGEDISISDSSQLNNDFIKINYAGETGYISSKVLTDEEVYVLSDKNSDMTAYSLTWKDAEYLLPPSHDIGSVNNETASILLNYAATADMEDDYVIIKDFGNILLSEELINTAHKNGAEYLTFVIANQDSAKWHISVSMKTYDESKNTGNNLNLGFSVSDTELKFKNPTFTTDIIVGIHNNFNVSAMQGNLKLNGISENYSIYFTLQSTEPIRFKGVMLTDGILHGRQNTEDSAEIQFEDNEIVEKYGNIKIPHFILLGLGLFMIVTAVFYIYKRLRFTRKFKN